MRNNHRYVVYEFVLALTVMLQPAMGQAGQPFSGTYGGALFHPDSHSIRLVLGNLGSAYLGPPIRMDLDIASVSPDGQFAVAWSGDNATLIKLDGQAPDVLLDGSIKGVDAIIWANGPSQAIVFSSLNRQAQWLRNLNTSPSIDSPIDLSALPGSLTLLAVDPSGEHVILASYDPATGSGGLYLVTSGGDQQLLTRIGQPTAAQFSKTGSSLWVADAMAHQVVELRFVDGGVIPGIVFTEKDGVTDPIALVLSGDEERLFVANHSDRSLLVCTLASQVSRPSRRPHSLVVERLDLEFAPTSLMAMPLQEGTYVMNPAPSNGEPFFLLQTQDAPKVLMVPASEVKP